MATITKIQQLTDDEFEVKLFLDYEEMDHLKGDFKDIHLFAENRTTTKSHIAQRGKNEATKYFLIPKETRQGFKFNNGTWCQRIDSESKVFFIYMVDRSNIKQTRREKIVEKIEKNYA